MNTLEYLKEKIEQHGYIFNLEEVFNTMESKAIKGITINDINNIFNNIEVRYFFEDSDKEDDYRLIYNNNEKLPKFKIIIFNESARIFRKDMSISFKSYIDSNTHGLCWRGCLFGSLSVLFKKCKRNKEDIKKKFDGYANYEFYEYLYNNLFTKENWCKINELGEVSFERLYFYLTNLCAAIKLSYKNNFDIYYSEKHFENSDYIVFDSRLLDKYGNKIYLIHTISKTKKEDDEIDINFINSIYVANSESLSAYNFSYSDIEIIKPLILYNNISELIFNDNIEDFEFR